MNHYGPIWETVAILEKLNYPATYFMIEQLAGRKIPAGSPEVCFLRAFRRHHHFGEVKVAKPDRAWRYLQMDSQALAVRISMIRSRI
jgi:hypothetical protein